MAPDDRRSAAVLVVAAWRERNGFRARITYAIDDLGAERTSLTAGDPERVLGIVEQWLRLVDQDRS